jgi:hypothetical protein
MKNIENLKQEIKKLDKKNKELFSRFFSIVSENSKMTIPEPMKEELKGKFNISELENQKIIRIDNLLTKEVALYNPLRSRRPKAKKKQDFNFNKKDPFCTPEKSTPIDDVGRIKGKHTITCANLSKFEKYHSVIIFRKHNPFNIKYKEMSEAFDISMQWFDKTKNINKKAIYPLLLWNYLWKSGASIIHPHLQVVASEKQFPKQKAFFNLISRYRKKYKREYIEDLFKVHKNVGLGISYKKIEIFPYLTPIKEKEIFIIGKYGENFKKAIYKSIKAFKKMDVESFNLGLIIPPLNSFNKKQNKIIARIVDRGNLDELTTDLGGMELYSGAKVISSDPYQVFKVLKNHLYK